MSRYMSRLCSKLKCLHQSKMSVMLPILAHLTSACFAALCMIITGYTFGSSGWSHMSPICHIQCELIKSLCNLARDANRVCDDSRRDKNSIQQTCWPVFIWMNACWKCDVLMGGNWKLKGCELWKFLRDIENKILLKLENMVRRLRESWIISQTATVDDFLTNTL